MQWPSRAEYTEAVRDYPHISLQDSRLRGGNPRRGRDNFVISDTGAFSIVFPIDMVSETFALRCWVKDVGNGQNRYEKISAYLRQKDLPYFVDFEYVPEGIWVNGVEYPITRMEWVEGVSLREFIEQNLQNPHIFKVVADKFQEMVSDLHKHQIAHGDLQDGNILLKQNGNGVKIKLIDYDSLSVPALHGQPEEIFGLPEYQHPRRMVSGGQANEKVDYFSELVIYLSFLSLAEKPELWAQFGDENRVGRGLLFSKEDFENPNQSPVFRELANLSPNVQRLAATLKDFCDKTSIDQLARLEAILPKQASTTESVSTSTSPTSRSTLSQSTRSNPLLNAMKHITEALRNHWQSVTLGLALVICFIPLLIQVNTENKIHLDEITKLKNQLNQKESKTQELTSLVQTLESNKKKLSRENDRLREDLEDLSAVPNTIPGDVINPLQQLSETEAALASSVNKNQTLQSQLNKKNAEIRQLQNDITIARNTNRRLQNQTDASNSGIVNQNDTVQRLEKEKTKVFNENRRLREQNQNLIRQNRRLGNENEALQKQLDNTKRNNSNQAKKLPSDSEDDPQPTIQPQVENLISEPPKKIQKNRTVRPVDISRNNQGCFAFEDGDYDKAINQFEQVIKADSELEIAHYNLGCTFLEMKDYPKAINAFDEAVAINHNFKEAHYNLGLAQFRIKTFQSAKQDVEKALSIDPNYQLAQELLTEIENAQQ